MIAQYLWIIGSLIFLLLGTAHLRITLFGKKLFPNSETAETEMKNTHPRLAKDTTMWKAWIGFNASHSAGAMFFGIVMLYWPVSIFQFCETLYFFYLLIFSLLSSSFISERNIGSGFPLWVYY